MPDAFITSLATFWFLFQLHSCFQHRDTEHIPTITLYECSSSHGLLGKALTQKLGIASSNPDHQIKMDFWTHHLSDSKRSHTFDSDGYIKHLRGYELPMTSSLKFGHLNKHSDVPGWIGGVAG